MLGFLGCDAAALSGVYQITVEYTDREKSKTTTVFSADITRLVKPFSADFSTVSRSASQLQALVDKLNEMGFANWEDRDMPWQNFPQLLRIEVFQETGVVVKELNDANKERFAKLREVFQDTP